MLSNSLENTAIIIEGAMRLHNYLVDYRETNKDIHHLTYERELYQSDITHSHAMPVQTGTDLGRPQGNITNDERMDRIKGMVIRDGISQQLADLDMHRKTKHWKCNTSSHTFSLTDN